MPQGILQDLHRDHEEVADLIDRMMKSDDGQERSSIFKKMMSELLAHSHAEQSVLYRKMEKSDDEKARSFAYEGDNEHRIVEQQLQEMAGARNKAGEQWSAQLQVLQELVSHHIKEEESTGFSCARSEFDAATLKKLGEHFRRKKEKLLAAA